MVAKDGTPKILDFGLARIMPIIEEPEEANQLGSQDETRTLDANQLNKPIKPPTDPSAMSPGPKLMGTPSYMSPEQAESEVLDHRTDIFSFGVVMYEALTGKKAFEGSSRASLLGRIINENPEPAPAVKPVTPYLLWHAIERCLRKNRTVRTQTALELLTDLKGVQKDVAAGTVLVDASTIPEPVAEPVPESVAPKPVPFWRHPAAIGFAIVMLIVGLGAAWFLKPVFEPPLRKFQWEVEGINWPAISPDGKRVAYSAGSPPRLWIRDLDSTTPREIPDSDEAFPVFWSPGSDEIGFVVGGSELRKASATTGAGLTLHKQSGTSHRTATWRPDGTIIQWQVVKGRHTLASVSAQGGPPTVILEPDSARGELSYSDPHALPDGRTLVFVVRRTGNTYDLVVQVGDSLQTIVRTNPGEDLSFPTYAPSGHLVYERRSGGDLNIWALPFDAGSLQATDEPFIVAQEARNPSVSHDGTLVYRTGAGGGQGQLVWVDRQGQVTGAIGQPKEEMVNPSLSPDGRQVAVQASEQGNAADVWVYDTQRGTATRLTFDERFDGISAWSSDGIEVVFTSTRNGNADLFRRRADGSGVVTSLLSSPVVEWAPDWSRDGRFVGYGSGNDIWAFEPGGDGEPFALFETEHNEQWPAFSPDSRYVAYHSNESGRNEVYAMRFPSGQGRWQVSSEGGQRPRWNGDGTELFFVSGDTLMAVEVSTRGVFRADIPKALFSASTVGSQNLAFAYDVSSDGQRFVVVQQVDEGETSKLTVVQNWYAEFKDKEQ